MKDCEEDNKESRNFFEYSNHFYCENCTKK